MQRGCHDYCSRKGPLDHPLQETLLRFRCYKPTRWKISPCYFPFPPLSPSTTAGFPCKLNASVHGCAENHACSFISLSAVTMSPLLLAKTGGRIKTTVLQHCSHVAITRGYASEQIYCLGQGKKVSKDVLRDPGHYRTILHRNPQTYQIHWPISVKFHQG